MRLREPCDLDGRCEDEGEKQKEGPDGGAVGGLHGAADVGIAGDDVEGHAKGAKDHE